MQKETKIILTYVLYCMANSQETALVEILPANLFNEKLIMFPFPANDSHDEHFFNYF